LLFYIYLSSKMTEVIVDDVTDASDDEYGSDYDDDETKLEMTLKNNRSELSNLERYDKISIEKYGIEMKDGFTERTLYTIVIDGIQKSVFDDDIYNYPACGSSNCRLFRIGKCPFAHMVEKLQVLKCNNGAFCENFNCQFFHTDEESSTFGRLKIILMIEDKYEKNLKKKMRNWKKLTKDIGNFTITKNGIFI
jgi:hypothetical protein